MSLQESKTFTKEAEKQQTEQTLCKPTILHHESNKLCLIYSIFHIKFVIF